MMTHAPLSSETIHASCVMIDGEAVLLRGLSGSGKSDLALRLVDRGAALISDDYTFLRRVGERLVASPPPTIAGKIEVRGLGVIDMPYVSEVDVRLLVELDAPTPRMPEENPRSQLIAGVAIPIVTLPALEASSAIKVELALRQFGLDDVRP
jgi:serine kinase of HPr protein (carbohydrate metabolism regulator)